MVRYALFALCFVACTAGPLGLRPSEVTGVIGDINYATREIKLSGSGMLSTIAYDSGTAVEEEGTRLRPEDLHVGDTVAIRVSFYNGRYVADRIRILTRAERP
jgi:hypothetical protein